MIDRRFGARALLGLGLALAGTLIGASCGGGAKEEATSAGGQGGDTSTSSAGAGCASDTDCGEGSVCHAGQCCTPGCGARECGQDQCGGSCGACAAGSSCSTDGLCVPASWTPKAGPLKTQWTSKVDPVNVLPEYPRPQLVRKDWANLNGLWEFEHGAPGQAAPVGKSLGGTILVPFPIESSLSGVMEQNVVDSWYRRRFVVPIAWQGKRVRLNFGAVDWESEVFVNGKSLGTHRGGYDGFSYDITDHLQPNKPQELVVRVHDATDQARGKQSPSPKDIFYTAATGIWQTVWLEPVPAVSIKSLAISPDIAQQRVSFTVTPEGDASQYEVSVTVKDGSTVVGTQKGSATGPVEIPIPAPKLWSPNSPFLYDVEVTLSSSAGAVDSVQSYFGMRSIAIATVAGDKRVLLNGKPIFMMGPLDQGFWPDGIYTAPTDDALQFDLKTEQALGFNMVRKHIKVEPERWFYYADKLGLLVWQDMPSGDNGDAATKAQWEIELHRMVESHRNHPSIVVWVPFNESWGEYEPARIVGDILAQDPTRLVTPASGWNDVEAGHIQDAHCYPGPCTPSPASATRARVNGEFGGWGLGVPGHLWGDTLPIYMSVKDAAELNDRLIDGIGALIDLKRKSGLNGAVYTQITDVEHEVNGLLTYDRIPKVDPERYRPAVQTLIGSSFDLVVPTSEVTPQPYRYVTTDPGAGVNWQSPSFDDATWKTGNGPFGAAIVEKSPINTAWTTPDIWLRRSFTLGALTAADLPNLRLYAYHDEDVQIYLNGVLAASALGYTKTYVPLTITPEALAALKAGSTNTMAIHVHQTAGGQYIDVGMLLGHSE